MALVGAALAGTGIGGRSLFLQGVIDWPRYIGPVSDHFDGQRFFNPANPTSAAAADRATAPPGNRGGPLGFLRFWNARRSWDRGPWPDRAGLPPGPAPPPRVGGAGLRVTFVNHSTVLLQTAGLNLVTDPVWSERASPLTWAGPKRYHSPGICFEDLPRIDAVLLSHDHYDHLDLATLGRLAQRDGCRVYTGLGNKVLLERQGLSGTVELDWWQHTDIGNGVRLHCVPAHHFSGRSLWDRDTTLWNGFVLDGPAGLVYFAGDTGWGSHFEQVGRELGAIRLALLPIGAYKPASVFGANHIAPAEAIRAHQALGAGTSVAIHYGTFSLTAEGEDEPVADLQRVLEATPPPVPRFWALAFGEGRDVPER